jgi:mRNA interferase MazF
VKRGDLYRVYKATRHNTKNYRVFVVVSRHVLIDSKFSTVTCAPVYTSYHGLSTQVHVGISEGLKYDGSIHCDELVSIPKNRLTDYIGTLPKKKMIDLNKALAVALEIE